MATSLNLTDKTDIELTELLKQKRETLRELRFSAKTARVKDSNDPANVRKDIARILTETTRRERAA